MNAFLMCAAVLVVTSYARMLSDPMPHMVGVDDEVEPQQPKGSLIPQIVHMTLRSAANVSCEDVDLVNSWMDKNPGYKLRVSDDVSMRQMMVKYYPKLLPLYDGLIYGVERADMWRYLVVHQYGGIYADTDVDVLKPLDAWVGSDALAKYDPPIRLIVSKEKNEDNNCAEMQCNQWTFAAAPGHPALQMAADNIQNWVTSELFKAVRTNKPVEYRLTVIERTGPMAWSNAIAQYLVDQGHIENASELERSPEEPWQLGDVLVLPWTSLSGFCSKMANDKELQAKAFVCHNFHGSWKDKQLWPFQPQKHYKESCQLPASAVQPLDELRSNFEGSHVQGHVDGGRSLLAGSDGSFILDPVVTGSLVSHPDGPAPDMPPSYLQPASLLIFSICLTVVGVAGYATGRAHPAISHKMK